MQYSILSQFENSGISKEFSLKSDAEFTFLFQFHRKFAKNLELKASQAIIL